MIAVITSMAPHGYVVAFDDASLRRTSGASGCTHVASGQSNRASQGRALERSVVVQIEDRLSDKTKAADEPPAFVSRVEKVWISLPRFFWRNRVEKFIRDGYSPWTALDVVRVSTRAMIRYL